jgi:hypothetical protein
MAKRKVLLIFFTNQGIMTLKWGDSTLSSLFSRLALLPSFLVFFYCLPMHTAKQYIGALVATPPLCSGPYLLLPHVQHHWIGGFLGGSRASASTRSGQRQTPGTSTGGTRTTLDGGILSCGGSGTDGADLCAPTIGKVVFCRCVISLIYVTAREATAVEITPSSCKIDVHCCIVSLSCFLLSSFV